MKKTIEKIICVLISIAMIIPTCLCVNIADIQAASRLETNAGSSTYYKEQISEDSKIIYDYLVEYYAVNQNTGTLKCSFDGEGMVIKASSKDEFVSEIKKIYISAAEAFLMDYPQVFWIRLFNASYEFTNNKDGTYTLNYIKLIPQELYSGGKADISAYNKGVKKAVKSIKKSAGKNATQYELLVAIHDYVCKKLTYTSTGNMTTTSAVLFCGDKKSVCEGYCKSFKVLCDYFGIDCITVAGNMLKGDGTIESHKWNYVELNNKWYLVDLACDDQRSGIGYKYFLVGKKSKGFYYKISKSHITRADYWKNGIKNFTYPTLNTIRYKKSSDTKINSLRYYYRSTFKYTGYGRTPRVKIKDGIYTLKKGKDYTVTYKNNKEKGTALIILKGIGKYKGKKRLTFTIK
ncbi:MAG: transglutaminase domain-containing protein [Eubacterium sp.]